MMKLSRLLLTTSGCLLFVAVSGCGSSGEETVDQVNEVLVRTAAANLGQRELAKVGAEVSGPLSCSTSRQDDGVDVSCTGTTLDGRAGRSDRDRHQFAGW